MRLSKRPAPRWNGSDESMISQCFEQSLNYRGYFEAISSAVTAPKENQKVDPGVLPGNIAIAAATLEFSRLKQIIPATPYFVAASYKGVSAASANLNYDGTTPYFVRALNRPGRFEITSASWNYDTTDAEFRAKYWPESLNRKEMFSDSEHLLVNALDAYLKYCLVGAGKNTFRRAGAIYIFSERIPCERCVSVIAQFLARYRKFRVIVGFMHGHGAQSIEKLVADLGPRASVYRVHLPEPLLPGSGPARTVTFELRVTHVAGPTGLDAAP